MKKIYLLLLVVTTLSYVNAQKKAASVMQDRFRHVKLNYPQNAVQGTCDTLNFSASAAWGIALYTIPEGFVSGTNTYGDLQKAQYFDASSTTDIFLTRTWIGFGAANTGDTTKVVPVNVYDGTSGSPGALLGTANLSMGTIMSDVNNNYYSEVVFNPAIALPASKQFFVSASLVNLNFSGTPPDTLAVYSSNKDSTAASGTGAWDQQSDSSWLSFDDINDWGIRVALYIFPFTSDNATCSLLPVHLLSFTAQQKDNNVLLNWNVTQELNMKEYVVERADGNLSFKSVGTVAATNGQTNHAYSFTDANALASGSKLFYRLKQVDNDGKFTYSNIITLPVSAGVLSLKVVNPFRNTVQLQINSPYTQKLQAAIYDLQGRKVTNGNEQTLVAGQNLISIPVTNSLAKGVYILNVYVGTSVYKYKILNQ